MRKKCWLAPLCSSTGKYTFPSPDFDGNLTAVLREVWFCISTKQKQRFFAWVPGAKIFQQTGAEMNHEIGKTYRTDRGFCTVRANWGSSGLQALSLFSLIGNKVIANVLPAELADGNICKH